MNRITKIGYGNYLCMCKIDLDKLPSTDSAFISFGSNNFIIVYNSFPYNCIKKRN